MDSEYTKGFKAGLAWRQAEIIKLLEEKNFTLNEFRKAGQVSFVDNVEMIKRIITLIKVQENLETDLQENLIKGEK